MIPINFQGIEESSIIGVNKLITFNKNIMELSVYQKADFLKELGYKVGIADGTENYPHHVTKKGTQLNCSINFAFNLETKKLCKDNQ